MHISKFPQCSWSVILQQAWPMRLKDRVKPTEDRGTPGGSSGKAKIREPCKRYNAGKCTYGAKCMYEHRCAIKKCGKFGHGAHICRLKHTEDRQSATTSATPRGAW